MNLKSFFLNSSFESRMLSIEEEMRQNGLANIKNRPRMSIIFASPPKNISKISIGFEKLKPAPPPPPPCNASSPP
uniref:Uncharacterized protein n=1 Tax=Romanomermis culicivorax TaxID=13658 RepID=A0A915J947_ROMCU